ncbi:hypothetical protein ACS5PK_00760 [Roseateles sp. DB2]|uniref:hypothetical protein n=1 Tax=Roseateles sp. DB2 TaxID=3453717 RepID=UPI003EE82D04
MNKPQQGAVRRAWLLCAALALAGCAAVQKVEVGDVTIKERLAVTIDSPWNQFGTGMGDNTPTWTKEGITIDALQFYVGIRDGALLAPQLSGQKDAAPLVFKSGMQPEQVVALFQSLMTRDGSAFTLEKIAPTEFVGTKGFRFEYTLTRKIDDVRLQGVGWGAIKNGDLFLVNYAAPRLRFFGAYLPQAEAIARSARVKG